MAACIVHYFDITRCLHHNKIKLKQGLYVFQEHSRNGIFSHDPKLESEHQREIMMNNEQGEFQWKEIN